MDTPTENATDGQGSAVPSRHTCQFPGCEKTFIRKEHLTRHEKSHAPQRSFVCYVCQRGFTRNDILRRHIARHNSSARATARNGRACDGCHSSKIKCEGGQPCSPCIKRGVECKFERDEVTVLREALSNSAVTDDADFDSEVIGKLGNLLGQDWPRGLTAFNSSCVNKDAQADEQHHGGASRFIDQNNSRNITNSQTRAMGYDASLVPPTPSLPVPVLDVPELFMSGFEQRDFEMQESSGDTTPQMVRPAKDGLINLENTSSFSDTFPRSMAAWRYKLGNTPVRPIPTSVTKEHYELYVDHFHYRWPIIHVPSFDKGDDPYVLSASVEMIGAWLQGSGSSKMVALTLHDRLTNHIFQRMYQKPSYADRYRSWPMPFYQATLLNIIFGFYCGEEKIMSRVMLLCSMLISSLRDLGFFRSEIATLQESEATFYPYIMSKQEERKRLAVALFKIDCYFSIIRGEPMTLRCEELYFSLPSTFCLFNGPGLHIWEARAPEEPVQRSQETVSSMISDRSFSSISQPFVLVEDIQLGMCASQADIWQYSEEIQSSLEHDINSLIRQKSLREGLNSWKRLFDQTSIEDSEPAMQGMTNKIPMKYYYGVEDHSEVGWQEVVLNRPQGLLFDTAMLYHLFGLHIHANIRIFETLASSKKDSRIATGGDGILGKEHRTRRWTNVVCSRQAIWHASNIVAIHRSRFGRLTGQIKVVNESLDPIAHVAVAVGSLVVWAYCYFNEKGCAQCIGPAGISVEVELMDILTKNEDSEKWIELGGLATIDGHTLCRCNVEKLVQVFQNYLPSGVQKWDMADTLSGVLNKTV